MSTYRLDAALSPGRDALPRLVARLHALGVTVTALRVERGQVRATLESTSGAARLQAALARSVDVRLVTVHEERPLTTTYVVLREESGAA